MDFPFDNSYARLPDYFYAHQLPQAVSDPQLIRLNEDLAVALGLNPEALRVEGAGIFSGNVVPASAEPLAMAYTGHQFGHFNPQLGDGRAILLGELIDQHGKRYDVQLKGAGRTPFSRGGDGRAALGPVLREYILCEFMQAMGIPTTRALAAVTTGDRVARDRMLPGAIITRLSASYVRVGTFQYFAARDNRLALQELTDYVVQRNFPELANAEQPWLALLAEVIARQARLIASWMQLGFIHGVMNTDNVSIVGETIDYGPCAFIDGYHPDTVFSSIDQQGRYAYQNQPSIGHWNLCRFAETLIPLGGEDTEAVVAQVQAAIDAYPGQYQQAWLDGMRTKLGLQSQLPQDRELADDLLLLMARVRADFTLVFRRLSTLSVVATALDQDFIALFGEDVTVKADVQQWLLVWRSRLQEETQDDEQRQSAMLAVNPLYIPRNHLIEAAIRAAEDQGDFEPFHHLVELLQQPFTEQPGCEEYAVPPRPEQVVHKTFCGT